MAAVAITSPNRPVRHPAWQMTYKGAAIAQRIETMVTEVSYVNKLGGAHELEFVIEDRRRKWQGPWYPQQGDLVTLEIGYEGESLLDCGDYQVDEVELEGPPDTIHLRCLSAFITPSLRTPNSARFETMTLMQIAQAIASKHGLTVVGAPNNINVTFQRVTQKQETDLAFIKRLADEHNYEVTVKNNKLVFTSRPALEAQAPVFTIARNLVTKFAFKNRTQKIYKAATISYLNPATKQLVTATVAADPAVATGDTLKLPVRAENQQQATLRAQGELKLRNRLFTTGTLGLEGTQTLVAGLNVTAQGFGVSDGVYLIVEGRHRLDRPSGYSTELEVRRAVT